jgi:HK97 family phage portal protein
MTVLPAAGSALRPSLVRGRDGSAGIPPPSASLFGSPGPYVYDAQSARRIPAVGRALQLFTGLVKQMPMDAYRGDSMLAPTPTICQRPDPDRGSAWFVQVNVEDYLLSGNAISYITSVGADGWPLSVAWLPALWTYVIWDSWYAEDAVRYVYLGMELDPARVIHVRRGADRMYPVRGVGVVEEYLSTLDRVAMEEEYERGALSNGAVPSVAVIAPQATLDQTIADDAKDTWLSKFGGPVREPVILPNGTQVVPLAWSPTDTQLAEARRLSLVDVANMFNLDGYWLGAPVAGMTYRTAAPQYQQILRTSLEPVLADFEDAFSFAWLPRGTNVRFRRSQLLREDLTASSQAAQLLYGAGIWGLGEARITTGVPADPPDDIKEPAAPVVAAPAAPEPTTPSPDDPNAPEPEGETGGPET